MMKKEIIKCLVISLICYYVICLFVDDSTLYGDIGLTVFISVFVIYFGFKKLKIKLEKHITKAEKRVMKISKNYQEVMELNKKFNFESIRNQFAIKEREFSVKSYYRVLAIDILKYYIENNKNNFRDYLMCAIKNKENYDKYMIEFEKINNELDAKYISDNLHISKEKFIKLEKSLLKKVKINDSVYNISVKVYVYYRSPRGRNKYSKNRIVYFDELEEIYNSWLNGKTYEVTSKMERSIMNDSIRYNVLKRDNFTCVLCGATSKDGAKLQVDHIIPVSKGGKTVMSNLQTLCDRCNKGKSDITDEDSFCPLCGGMLVERKGKYGTFWGCSNYPKCHYTKEK